jgi:hypothetical protein
VGIEKSNSGVKICLRSNDRRLICYNIVEHLSLSLFFVPEQLLLNLSLLC